MWLGEGFFLQSPDNFYSHIPCGMWRLSVQILCRYIRFLLTHPVWDVTVCRRIPFRNMRFLLTHPVWDVTSSPGTGLQHLEISTHTSRVGCDLGRPKRDWISCRFLLTHPVWDVTDSKESRHDIIQDFYSHIPCGMWPTSPAMKTVSSDFYSHIPCGMWQYYQVNHSLLYNFYSHIPCGMWRVYVPVR